MGIKAVESHLASTRHKQQEDITQTSNILQYCSQDTTAKNTTSVSASCTDESPAATVSSINESPSATSSSTRESPAAKTPDRNDLRVLFGSTSTLKSEVLWAMRTVCCHGSYKSNDHIEKIFRVMFPDSELAATFSCGKDKTGYLVKFGIAPVIKQQLISEVSQDSFVVMFDESLNRSTNNKQMDLHLRYWTGDRVQSRYFGSQFLGHSTAQDLFHNFMDCVEKLNLRNMVSISMDGPNVNWKFFELLQQEQVEQFGGSQLAVVGSCGLHTLHNAFRHGFAKWQIDKLLKPRNNKQVHLKERERARAIERERARERERESAYTLIEIA
ncbi:putative kinetochore protein SPC25 [Labeo rohita]|uniref:Kinetochore protein SPC25 n=1 Tax=Labeo rohita TaxID=84645 RepID=A0ABQ8MSK0_LABRO|nr:putative kinetochore protein SPC25 [Labeo rohita]